MKKLASFFSLIIETLSNLCWLTPLPCKVSLPVISSVYELSKYVLLPGFKKLIDPTVMFCTASFAATPKANFVLGNTLHSRLA